MGLKRFDQVLLSSLKEGDRFYFQGKKNEVCQFIRKEKERFNQKCKYFWKNGRKECNSKIDKVVIYLRNIND